MSPVYNVQRIHESKIKANSYNPNAVAPPEMKLLELSIWEDGYTMPIVCYYIENGDYYEIVDGYHRYTTLKTSQRIYDREEGVSSGCRNQKRLVEPYGFNYTPQ